VLLVEDDPLVRDVLAETLADRGHRVIACQNGEECLRALPEVDERVVLMTDVALPGRSGRALADEFHRRRPGQPVVFATGLPKDALPPLRQNEAMLLKPFTMRDMLATVDRVAAAI
jgi:DNA-binding NtrC family response regulator